MHDVEQVIRDAGRQHRRVLVRVNPRAGEAYERELEPYGIVDGVLHAFSYLRNEFRTVKMEEIADVKITPRSFEPRRPVDL
ncbi:MAG TPA: WYL domain-containing protein [Gemmatimonadales bacterium]|nr:WYL domain-containing protein [Gemmatimonadales bacterium]